MSWFGWSSRYQPNLPASPIPGLFRYELLEMMNSIPIPGLAAPASYRLVPRSMESDAPPTTDDLGLLLVRVGDGDKEAFASLYDAVAEMVYALVLRVVRDPAQSEEVAQDVMLEVWRLAGRFDASRGSARGWIATMAHRRAVDLVRSAESSRQRGEAYGRGELSGSNFDVVLEEVVERDEHGVVRDVLSNLTPLQREAIMLAYYDGLTYREVAVHLDTPVGTVKTRIRDGLTRLRAALGTEDG